MSLWLTIALGATAGLAAFIAWRALFPPAVPLAVALARLSQRPAIVDAPDDTAPWKRALGRRARPLFDNLGIDLQALTADLRITGTTVDEHAGTKVTSALLPLAFLAPVASVLALGGLGLPLGVLGGASVTIAAVGFVAPDLTLRRGAQLRRREFLVAFGSYLDLVAISLAGGMGTEAALVEAARIGDSWAFRLLRRAVDVAQIEGSTIWHTLSRLGDDVGVRALGELAASVALSGTEGAKVRSSIAVKAETLRNLELAEAESDAQAATERLAIPTAMLLFGFVLLVGFPAVISMLGHL